MADASIWKDYRLLILQSSNKEKLASLINDARIKGAITCESIKQRFEGIDELYAPFTLKELYVQWFENENDGLTYVYVPKRTYIPFKFLKSLTDNNIPFYLEGAKHASCANFASCAILFIALLFLSSRKSLFVCVCFPFLLLSVLVKGELIFSAIFLLHIFFLYLVELLFVPYSINKEKRKERLKNNIFIFLIFAFVVFLTLLDTYLSYLYVFLALVASLSLGYILEKFKYLFQKAKDAERIHAKMQVLTMHPTLHKQIYNKKKSFMLICFILLSYSPHALFNICCLSPLSQTYGNMLSLPLPSKLNRYDDFTCDSFISCRINRSGDALPDLTTYIADRFASITFPYRRADEAIEMPKKDESVVFRDFYLEKDGVIKEKKIEICSFNDAFINAHLKNLPHPSIEEMLKSEKGFVSAFYNFKFFKITRYNDIDTLLSLFFISFSLCLILLKMVVR